MATYAITIGGASKSLKMRSLSIQQTLNGLDTLRADVVSTDGSYRPAKNAVVSITENGTKIFEGLIQTARERWLRSADWDGIVTTIEAVDYGTYAQRRIVNETLASGTLKSMLTTLVTNYLSTYGVSLHASQPDGPTLEEITATDAQLSQVLEQLATLAGYVWKITYDKELYVWAPGDETAPFDITSANGFAVGDIVVEPTNDDFFANTIYVNVTGAGPATSTETFTAGGGSTETYTTKYPASQSINDAWPNVLLVNSVNQGPVKWGDPDATFAWGWDHTTNTLKHNGNGYVPSMGDTISVTYAIGYPYQVSAVDATSVAAIGPWEKKIAVAEALTEDAAQDLADAELARRLADVSRVTYDTYQLGAFPGDDQTINVTERNINGTYLITDIWLQDVGRMDSTLRRTVTAVASNVYQQGWRNTIANWTLQGGGGGGGNIVSATGGVQGALPADPDRSVQINDAGSFGSDDGLLNRSGQTYGVDSYPAVLEVVQDDNTDQTENIAVAYAGNESEALCLRVDSAGQGWLHYGGPYLLVRNGGGTLELYGHNVIISPLTFASEHTHLQYLTSIQAMAVGHATVTTTPFTINATGGSAPSLWPTIFQWNRSAAGTINLPAVSAFQANPATNRYRLYGFRNIGSAWLTLDGNSSETINGALVKLVAPGQTVWLSASSSQWITVAETPAKITVTLTDAQVKALPTTPITLVPAPGSGYRIVFKRATLLADFATAAYTNIDSTTAYLYLSTNGAVSSYIADDAGSTPTLGYLSVFLDNTKKSVDLTRWFDVGDLTNTWGLVADVQTGFTGDNQPLTLVGNNNGSGDWTGGNAANSLRVTVEIDVEAI